MKVKATTICPLKIPVPITDIRQNTLFVLASGIGEGSLAFRTNLGYAILSSRNNAEGNFVNNAWIQPDWKGVPVEQTNEIEYKAI